MYMYIYMYIYIYVYIGEGKPTGAEKNDIGSGSTVKGIPEAVKQPYLVIHRL